MLALTQMMDRNSGPRRLKWLLAGLLMILPLSLMTAQETEAPPAQPQLGLNLGIGVESFDDETYQKLSLSPDLAIGKFGIAFDLTIHWLLQDGVLQLRREDWIPEDVTFSNVLSLYLGKFRYVRYGFKGDPLYAKFGSIDDGSIGNGFIMGGYSNTLFLPERRIFGLSFDLDGALFNFPVVGLETHVGDLSAFDVWGTRLFFRPLIYTQIPILKNIQIGASVAADLDPYRYATREERDAAEDLDIADPEDTAVVAAGGDFKQPLLDNPAFTLALFGDIATIEGLSLGGMLGVGGRIVRIITYGAQIRFVGEGFLPVYFDSTYDLNRAAKYALVEGDLTTPAYTGWLVSLGASLFEDALALRFTLDGPFRKPDEENEDNFLNYPHLQGLFAVKPGLVPGFSLDVGYDKILIREFADLADAEGSLVRARVGYHTGPAVISVFYQLRYEANDWKSPEITSGLESSIELY